jgi:hypothetical protein
MMDMETDVKLPEKKRSWWKKIIAYFQKLIREIIAAIYKPPVSDAAILIHSQAMAQSANMAAIAISLDNEKFSNKEFLLFLRINNQIARELGEYKGLNNSIQLLRVALETKDSFLKIEQIELRYRGFTQQEFYNFVFNCLGKELTKVQFKDQVQQKIFTLIPKIKTEEGKVALQSYFKELDNLAKDELGLKLLYIFKQYDLGDFSLLRTVADIASRFHDKALENIKELIVLVRVNQEIFDRLGKIIDVPPPRQEAKTYALMLQYIALKNRHQASFLQFQQLVALLKDWAEFYKQVVAIRQEYPPTRYRIPKSFNEDIPGEDLYFKYQGYFAQD